MNNIVLGVIGVMIALIFGLSYGLYEQVQANGALSETLDTAQKANNEWSRVYKATVNELNSRQERLDEALAKDAKNMQDATKLSRLFRIEIDQLKAQNNEYRKQLEAALPTPIIDRLCERGFAAPELCAGVSPAG